MDMAFANILNSTADTNAWLTTAGVKDLSAGVANLREIAQRWTSEDRVTDLLAALQSHLPRTSAPDMALNNLERFLTPDQAAGCDILFASDPQALPNLLTLFSASQYLSDLLARDPALYLELRKTGGNRCTRVVLDDLLASSMQRAATVDQAKELLRKFKHEQTLRIAYGDLIVGHRVEQVAQQISYLASAICEAAYLWARRNLAGKLGTPLRKDQLESQFVILALGKLGGHELNYSSDIDLIMVYDQEGNTTAGSSRRNGEFYQRLTRDVADLLGDNTPLGCAYRVDLRLRPLGAKGTICRSMRSTLKYYDFQGRTWERQALIKARPIAGDINLGKQLLNQLAHWIYRPNLNRTDIAGIKALKRKIERRAVVEGEDRTNIKTGHGGIRDIEFVIQFLQLLNGCLLKEVRANNTFYAIRRLERAGCLTPSEGSLLFNNYSWLRKLEHRLQIVFDLQTHTLPDDANELERTALRMGYADSPKQTALAQFQFDLTEKTQANRAILDHLLHGAFRGGVGSKQIEAETGNVADESSVPLEVDLILDPYPGDVMIHQALSRYGFRDEHLTYQRLMDLARESTRFLSPRRCAHFFAAITPALLQEVSRTPDPDATLVSLATVSDSLGAKGILWELFSFNPPTLRLYVRICALTDYLASILKQNPGMIDELMDALQLERLPTQTWLTESLAELSRGAEDLALILHSFKSTQHMRIGIRDLVDRDALRDIHQSLADVANVCLDAIATAQYRELLHRHGRPEQFDYLIEEFECPFLILGMGKLGGNEPNYHSDLDVIFLYDAQSGIESRLADGVTSQFFFSELAANVTSFISHSPKYGQLYEIDSRLRPTGKSGPLAVSLDEFERYFRSGDGQLWERQALCKARPVFGREDLQSRVTKIVHQILRDQPWEPKMASQILDMRKAMEHDCTEHNLKRGVGGTVDIEFAIQMLQLKHARDDRSILVPGTLTAIEKLVAAEFLSASQGQIFSDCYQLLRGVEAQLRLMNTTARHDLPTDANQLAKLASLLHYESADKLISAIQQCREAVRQNFLEVFEVA